MQKKDLTKDNIYNFILDDIINLQYKPGEYIKENDLASRFNLSRTPVREVIKKLANEGYVKIVPRHGNIITKIDVNHVRQMMQMRIILESKVFSILINTDSLNMKNIYDILDRQKNIVEDTKSAEEFWQLDNQFHKSLFDLARRDIWWQMLESFEPHYMRYRKLDITDANKIELLYIHHKNLVLDIENKRLNEIEDILKSHVYCCIERIPILLEKYPAFFTGVE